MEAKLEEAIKNTAEQIFPGTLNDSERVRATHALRLLVIELRMTMLADVRKAFMKALDEGSN